MGKPSPRRARALEITRAMKVRNEHAQEHAHKRAMNMREAHYERNARNVVRSRLMKEQREAITNIIRRHPGEPGHLPVEHMKVFHTIVIDAYWTLWIKDRQSDMFGSSG